MFRRRGGKEKTNAKGNVIDHFDLEIDPGDLKFDESALERELADMMGSDGEDGLEFVDEPEFKAQSPRPKSKPQPPKQEDSDDELIKQLQSKLELDDDDDDKTFESRQFSSAEEIRTTKPITPPVPSSPTPVTNENLQLILDRKRAFESAIHSLSTSQNISDADSTCLRRYERLLTSINAMATKAQNNIPIELSELPPPPPQPRPNAQPLDIHPSQHTSTKRKTGENIVLDYITGEGGNKGSELKTAGVVKQLKGRLMEYRAAVVVAQKEGNKRRELELMVAVNALVESIPQIESGVEEFDEDSMPPPPDQFSLPPDVLAEVIGSAQTPPSNHAQPATPAAPALQPQRVDPAVAALAKVAASTVASKESLMARIQMLKAMIQNSNDLQKRMYQRALDNYSKALRAFEAGVKYDYGGLPPLPGCPQFTSAAPPPKRPSAGGAPGNQLASASPTTNWMSSNQARTLELLQKRQAELRAASAHCKSTGDIAKAKEYLRQSLGMNNMIRAVQAGLSVDLKQLPPAPGARATNSSSSAAGSAISNQPVLSGVACDPPVEFQTDLVNAGNDPVKICDRIIAQLEEQVKEAETLSKDHREAGLSNLADKFYDLADVSLKWISLTNAYKARKKVPHYSFEKANLSRLNMNPELGDNVLEVTPLRGISFPVPPGISGPHGLDTYVTMELPFPSSESPQKHSTDWVRHTNEPTDFGGYQASARFEVNRKAKSYERLLKGVKALKVTVFYNRGLLKKPAPLGTIAVKLTELVANATHTACYELMDGRKAAGGLLELRIRHRAPLEGTKFSAYEKPWVCVSTPKH